MDGPTELQPEQPTKNVESRLKPSRTFSLATLLIIVTAFSLWMGLAVKLPELAVPALILLAPAIVRGIAAIKLEHGQGHPTTLGEKAAHLYYSMLTMILIYMIGFGAIWTTSIASMATVGLLAWLFNWQQTDAAFDLAMIVTGVLMSIAVAILCLWLYWRWWPRTGKVPR